MAANEQSIVETQAAPKTTQEKLLELQQLQAHALLGSGQKRIDNHHKKGKLTARERIDFLLDPGTFNELDMFVTHRTTDFGLADQKILGDGVVTGYGRIDGRLVYIYAQDFTVFGGSLSKAHSEKICKVMDLAIQNGAPIIGLNDSGGARIQDGVDSLAGYADIVLRNSLASGVVPQISAIMGPCAGGASYSPALTDFILMVEHTSYMFATGPNVLKTVTKEDISIENLGGAHVHSSISGVSHFSCPNELDCLSTIRQLITYLSANNIDDPPYIPPHDSPNRSEEALNAMIPSNPNKPYDMKEVIRLVCDDKEFLEVQSCFATNLITGFARLNGYPIGIVAQQPNVMAGALDIDSADKGSRFIRFCDCFHIPIISFVDTPGFLPGKNQEHRGLIRHGAKLVYAYCTATVPKITVITRKAYGGGYLMCNKQMRTDIIYAWPTAEIAVMGGEGAVNILFKEEIERSDNPESRYKELVAEYTEKFATPYIAASFGYIDEIIEPRYTRSKLINALEMLQNKRASNPPKKHGNIPL